MNNTLKTLIHPYKFNLRNAPDRLAYDALVAKLKGLGLKKFAALARFEQSAVDYRDWLAQLGDGATIELETTHIFDNQWNTPAMAGVSDKGLRVFDWYEPIYDTRSIRNGYWLEPTEAIVEIRHITRQCGYCGKQERPASGLVFCPHCLDSEYLKSQDLHLTRLVPVIHTHQPRAPLTAEESAYLLPRYQEAQAKGSTAQGIARLAKTRADIASNRDHAIRKARIEATGQLWLLDHGLPLDLLSNMIYYDHRQTWTFGWRAPLSDSDVSVLLDVLGAEFPYEYEILRQSGHMLSSGGGSTATA
jgi:hypothetical protein